MAAVLAARLFAIIALVGLLLGGSAGLAAAADGGYETPVDPENAPLTLAATGLDLTVPIIVGLSLLVAGTTIVAVLALRGGRVGSGRH